MTDDLTREAEIRARAIEATYRGGDEQVLADDALYLLTEIQRLRDERDAALAIADEYPNPFFALNPGATPRDSARYAVAARFRAALTGEQGADHE